MPTSHFQSFTPTGPLRTVRPCPPELFVVRTYLDPEVQVGITSYQPCSYLTMPQQ